MDSVELLPSLVHNFTHFIQMSLSSHEVTRAEVEAAFATCEPQTPNLLKISSLKLVMRGIGFEPRNAQIDAMTKRVEEMRQHRIAGHGVEDCIDVDEFMELIKNQSLVDETKGVQDEMRGAFKLFDKESKGFITVENLRQVAAELGEQVGEEELEEMIQEASKTASDKVSETDFFNIMKKTCLY